MKSVFVFALIASAPAFAAAADQAVMSCSQVQMLQSRDDGSTYFEKSDITLDISASKTGKYGYEAKIASGGQSSVQDDVNVALYKQADVADLQEVVATVLPKVDWKTVVNVRVGDIGVAANQQDSAGAKILELQDGKGAVLGKIVELGWSFGVCGK